MSATALEAQEERERTLHRIWMAQANAIATILEQTDPKELQAALLNTSRQFLADNGVNVDSIGQTVGGHPVRQLSEIEDAARAAIAADDSEPLPAPQQDTLGDTTEPV